MDANSLLLLLTPLVVVEVGMKVWALIDLKRAARTRGPKALWGVLIVGASVIGWALYFVVGKDER